MPALATAVLRCRPSALLAAVAVLHAVSPLALMGVHWWFGIDETVYLSQINAHVPPGLFSAPRARGATLIAAPITATTSSVAAVRLWVTGLSGMGLFLAFRPWLALRRGYAVPLAALLFSSLWTVIYYGFEVMPNEWVAFCLLAACGLLLGYLRDGRRTQLAGVVTSMAICALFRPSDALYAGAALVASCLLLRGPVRARSRAVVAVTVGTALGSAEWVVEAFTRFGGLARRVSLAQAEQGGGGTHFAGAAQVRALAGPLLCRNGCQPHTAVAYQLWWPALFGLVVVGVRRAGAQRSAELVAVAVGVAMAAQYVFTVTYAAPRFLIPTYALLSVPAATGALQLARRVRAPRPRVAVRSALVAAFVAHVLLQAHVITGHIAPSSRATNRATLADARQLRGLGLGRPCLVLGHVGNSNAQVAYATGCKDSPTKAPLVRELLSDGVRVLWLSPAQPSVRFYGVYWRRQVLPGCRAAAPQVVYLSQRPAPVR